MELLQAIALLATYERKKADPEIAVSCKRNDILKLSLSDYKKWVEPATEAFFKAAKFLYQQKIYTSRDLPYSTQVVPLAVILAVLDDEWQNDSARNKIANWYWCGVFGELYGSAIETRFARDVVDVINWLDGGDEPITVTDCNFSPIRLDTLRSRNSAAYKGIFALLMRIGCLDFRSGVPIEVNTYFDEGIDIHHIFPQKWCKDRDILPQKYDTIINKTALSYQTNRIIGGNAPSIYLKKLRDKEGIGEARQMEILRSHVMDIDAITTDDFGKFIAARREKLLACIEQATGKLIARQSLLEEDDVDDIEIENGEN